MIKRFFAKAFKFCIVVPIAIVLFGGLIVGIMLQEEDL